MARKALEQVWKRADLKGRTWGPNKANNPFRRSNITIAIGREMVSIIQGENEQLIIKTKGVIFLP